MDEFWRMLAWLLEGKKPETKQGAEPASPQTLTDSLQQLVGGGVNVRRLPEPVARITGAHGAAVGNNVFLKRGDEQASMPHEFGHIADYRELFPDIEKRARKLDSTLLFGPNKRNLAGATNTVLKGSEAFSNVFTDAFTILQIKDQRALEQIARPTGHKQLDEYNTLVRDMMEELLKSPVYRQHPINQRRRGELPPFIPSVKQ